MQNVLSVNASHKIKSFQSDDSASFSFCQSHSVFFLLFAMVHKDKELLKNPHIMTKTDALFMAAKFNDSSQNNYAIIHIKYDNHNDKDF